MWWFCFAPKERGSISCGSDDGYRTTLYFGTYDMDEEKDLTVTAQQPLDVKPSLHTRSPNTDFIIMIIPNSPSSSQPTRPHLTNITRLKRNNVTGLRFARVMCSAYKNVTSYRAQEIYICFYPAFSSFVIYLPRIFLTSFLSFIFHLLLFLDPFFHFFLGYSKSPPSTKKQMPTINLFLLSPPQLFNAPYV